MIGALAAAPYLYRKLDETVRVRVESIFANHYRGLHVSVYSAALVDGGILVRGVSISDPRADGPRAELAYFEELFLSCKTDLRTLVSSTPEIVEVISRRPTIRCTRRPDGTWSAGRLFPLPKLGNQPPTITIEGATLELFDPCKNPTSSLTIRDGYFKVARQPNATIVPGGRAPLAITGYCTADSIRRVEVTGSFDPAGQAWQFNGVVDGLEVAPELLHELPGDCPERLCLLESLRGQVNGRFAVRYDANASPQWDYAVNGQLNRGRIDDSRLPHSWTDLRAGFHVDSRGFAIQNLTATIGPGTLTLDMRRDGFSENAPMVLVAKARQLRLDRQLAEIMPAKWQEAWQQSLPAGEIDLDATLRYDGATWTPDVTVACHNVAFTYYKFPYRLEHATGEITLRNNALHVDVTAYSDIEPVHLRAEIEQPGPDWSGYVTVDGRNIHVDQKLTKAMPPKPREIVESLNGHGSISLFVHYWRERGAAMHNRLSIGLNGCDLRYDKFPYPIHNVRGVVEANDKSWTFQDLVGTNDTGLVRCQGDMRPGPEGDVLTLHFTALSLPLEEELRAALRPSARQLWNELGPTGAVDLRVDVRHETQWKDPQIHVIASPVKDSVVIEPRHFPYRLEKVQGLFDYANGHVTIDGLRAEHGPSMRLSGRGFAEVDSSGGWRLHLENLNCGRISADRDLVQALPPRLKKAITEMHLSGPMSIYGSFDLISTGKPEEPLRGAWSLRHDLQQVRMAYNLPLENINGHLSLTGDFDGQHFRSRGELQLDSLTYKDFQFTEVRGPLWIDDSRVLLGAAVPPPQGEAPRTVTARCCGGTVRTDGWVMLGANPGYNFDAMVSQAQLGRIAQEVIAGRQKLTGELSGRVNIHGQGSGTHTLGGHGHVELNNADIYHLPLMVSLLKILSMRAPDSRAFSSSIIDFRLDGSHVYFDRINFHGDAISLRGTGEMGFDKNLQLTFYTVVGRDQWTVPLVSEVLGGASQQLMAIYVEGALDHPEVRKQALPAVTEALQEIQTELQNMGTGTTATATTGAPPPAGRMPPQRR